jgi:phosphorylcholine metabolism protein LicD
MLFTQQKEKKLKKKLKIFLFNRQKSRFGRQKSLFHRNNTTLFWLKTPFLRMVILPFIAITAKKRKIQDKEAWRNIYYI